MENTAVQKTSLAKSALPYGIIFGAILVLEFVASYSLGLNSADNKMAGVLMGLLNNLVLPFIFIFIACNNFKNKLNGGYISFGQSLKVGVTVTVIAALISSVITAIIYLVAPEVKAQILEQIKISMAAQPGMTSEGMNAAVKMSEMFMAPYLAIPITVLVSAFVGLIISLIVGAIVKKDNPGAF